MNQHDDNNDVELEGGTDEVVAGKVTIHQGGARSVQAHEVQIRQGGALRYDALQAVDRTMSVPSDGRCKENPPSTC